jgi:hypothetical protein
LDCAAVDCSGLMITMFTYSYESPNILQIALKILAGDRAIKMTIVILSSPFIND